MTRPIPWLLLVAACGFEPGATDDCTRSPVDRSFILTTATEPDGWDGCFRRALEREDDGRVGCRLVELVDPADGCELGGRTIDGTDERTGQLRCVVHQVAIGPDDEPLDPGAIGWVYDDFSASVDRDCMGSPARLGWVGAGLDEGASARLVCSGASFTPPAGVGEACGEDCETPVETLSGSLARRPARRASPFVPTTTTATRGGPASTRAATESPTA